ncbi:hypothetical protein [Lutibacter citreus]|uniref:hypothetical protein n=1 Tax=Lutibacter citreus TaxID=2138210 RepID=UPI000DBE6936|nr:hypothetical protein [Lutibacter citreus]
MRKSILTISFLLITISALFAQKTINNYKYILVPKQFEFQNEEDSYQVNSLTKFLFERAGFTALFTDETYPEDLARDRCLALKAKVKTIPSFLATKITIELVDCNNRVVIVTKEAKTKEKDFKKAYHSVIRTAFEDIENLNYSYEPTTNISEKVFAVKAEQPQKVEQVVAKELPIVKEEIVKKEVSKPIATKEKAKTSVENKIKTINKVVSNNVTGAFLFDNWGKSVITEKNNAYSVIGGDENLQFATIYKTSKPTIYIIKWAAFKQPQLLEVINNGNLKIDINNGSKIYKRVD